MIIDFHAHIFPDALAPRAMESLLGSCRGFYKPVSDGTVSGLLANMDKFGVDVSVAQPVITRHSQTKSVNEWSASAASPRIAPFGGLYPTEEYKRDVDFIVSLGLRGIKFHSEYQSFAPDDPLIMSICDYALSKGLILLHHAGFDPAYNPPFNSTPHGFANLAKAMEGAEKLGGAIVVAHLGGQGQWDDVECYLTGAQVYLDTSMGFEYYSKEQFLRIAKAHGTDRILFASDAPWSDAGYEKDSLLTMSELTDNDKTAILGGNAQKLMQL